MNISSGVRAVGSDGSVRRFETTVTEDEDCTKVSLPKDLDYTRIDRVEFNCTGVVAGRGDGGYFLIPRGMDSAAAGDYGLCFFRNHAEPFTERVCASNMPVYGVKSERGTFLAVVGGMPYSYTLEVRLGDGGYEIYPVFELHGEAPEADLQVEFFTLTGADADYSGMARRYRAYKIRAGLLRPIAERVTDYPSLAYTAKSVMIRVRCGWKPVPPTVLRQNEQNEPAMRVACTFRRVGDILDELRRQGVDEAEICLVGWNTKGHDGRWPQAFPVCEELGGETALRALLQKAKEMGYMVTCHTNSSDQYEIADCYDQANSRFGADGQPMKDRLCWSAGEMWQLCPKVGYEQAQTVLPRLADIGFTGGHYIDVLGFVMPRDCHNPKHPLTVGEGAEYVRKTCRLARELFGGVSSEGGYDHLAPELDYALYISFAENSGSLCDRSVPFWQIVYHGYVLSNPYFSTVNCTLKTRRDLLKAIEYGARPTYYFYGTFMDSGLWTLKEDARCDTDEELRESVAAIKAGYDVYRELRDLQTVCMDRHEEISPGVFEVTYADGTVIRVNYNDETYTVTPGSACAKERAAADD